jgi:serine/threonine protein kinase
MSFEIGDTVGAYTILGKLGSGGMGEVFKVEHTITRRVEAMKVLLHGQPAAHDQAQRFLREIQVQAGLSHPNIAAVHNAFWSHDDLVMVMELIEGDSLQKLLEARRVPLPAGLNYASQTLSALSYAHGHGVVHRDVSPANIIVTADGTVKLTDFGLAKAPSDLRLTRSGEVLGSLHYASPEQVQGKTDVDARSDIYAMGAVLYELVTGRKPFDADNAFALMLGHVEQPPLPPVEIDPSLPSDLNDIVLTALAKDPAQRFASADQFREALDQVRHALPSSRLRVRRRVAVGFAAAVIILGVSRQVLIRPASRPPVATTAEAAPRPKPSPFGPPAEPAKPAQTKPPRQPEPEAKKKKSGNRFFHPLGRIVHPHRKD